MEWGQILYLVGACLVGFMLYRQIRNRPNLFTSVNISRSLQTLGLLALLLIGFIGICVLLLRHSSGV